MLSLFNTHLFCGWTVPSYLDLVRRYRDPFVITNSTWSPYFAKAVDQVGEDVADGAYEEWRRGPELLES